MFERFAVIGVLVLSLLAFAGMLFVVGFIIYVAGPTDSALWLTAPFTGLTGFATWQLFRSARRMGFRGRPFMLFSRAFRDSVRLWGSGSLAAKVVLTTTATASVAGSVVAPQLASHPTPFDVFVVDSVANAVFRVDLETEVSNREEYELSAVLRPVGGATQTGPVILSGGRNLPRGSLYVVVETAGERLQGIVGFRPGSGTPVQVSRIEPNLSDAQFTGGDGVLHALQPDGSLWSIDIASGSATEIAQVAAPLGPFTYEAETKSLLMISGNDLVRIDPATGATTTLFAIEPEDIANVCGIADGPESRHVRGVQRERRNRYSENEDADGRALQPSGRCSANPCTMVVARRR